MEINGGKMNHVFVILVVPSFTTEIAFFNREVVEKILMLIVHLILRDMYSRLISCGLKKLKILSFFVTLNFIV